MNRFVRAAALAAAASFAAFAQTGAIAGKVIGPDGQPLQGAWVKIVRTDIKGEYYTETKKKGDYFHAGLPLGTYDVVLILDATKEKKKPVGGREVDQVRGVRTGLGEPKEINFDLAQMAKRQQAMQQAAETGTVTKEMSREMTPEQRAAFEKAAKERSESMKKNKALNDAFNAGMTALEAKDWANAVGAFEKASELDPNQHVVWANLAESHVGLAMTKTGDEQAQAFEKGIAAYNKAIELKPDDAAYHNNFALALVKAKKVDQAQEELNKAAILDPAKAGTYYFNLGAVMTNIGQLEAAGQAFKKATEADANHADAFYQYAMYLVSKAQTNADGSVTPAPGTKEALQKYVELKPDGPYAESAKGMLMAFDSKVETEYANPDAKKKSTKKKR
ncbi:MAG: carboxypeptidase regulatory-like domain-containing protein [Bryobacteraceae bacterium]